MFSHHWLETCRRAAHDIGKILQFIWLRRLVFCSPYSIRCRNLAHQAKGWKKCIQLNTITCKMHIEIIVNHTKGVFLLDNLMKEVLILTKPLILSSIFFLSAKEHVGTISVMSRTNPGGQCKMMFGRYSSSDMYCFILDSNLSCFFNHSVGTNAQEVAIIY